MKKFGKKEGELPEKYADSEMYMASDTVSYVEDVSDAYEDLKCREDEIFCKKFHAGRNYVQREKQHGLKWKYQRILILISNGFLTPP